ncbi:MAG: DUF167 domain-containing protein [Anaerolineaceae bacterium]|jgi:uncharacterized protein (TIGR00251 family)|nr:DUF167 domain-containing protein [Anaerolineaceae bacterium]
MKTGRNFELHDGKLGAAITVRVTPRMARNEITEIMNDGTVKIRLTAPPVEGRANQGLIEFLAEILGVRPAKIEIISGLTARDKIVTVMDISPEDLQARILQHLS